MTLMTGGLRQRLILGYLASLGAAFCYGVVAVIGRKVVSEHTVPLVSSAFSLLFGTIIVGALFFRHAAADAARVPRKAWLMASLAGLASAWGVASWFMALKAAPVVLVAPVVGTSPLFSILLTYVFLQRLERVTWRTLIGALLVVGGVALVAVGGT